MSVQRGNESVSGGDGGDEMICDVGLQFEMGRTGRDEMGWASNVSGQGHVHVNILFSNQA